MSGNPCEHVIPVHQEPRHQLVLANEFVRVFAVEIVPHDRTLCHHHSHDYLLYVASDAEIVSAARDEAPKRLTYSDGECEISKAGLTHVVENVGNAAFRNLVVELLPGSGTMRRGATPMLLRAEPPDRRLSEGTEVSVLLTDRRATILSLSIEPGAEVEVFGPAVIATPYANRLNADEMDSVQVHSNPICDFAWIPPEQDAVLWGCWEGAERAIIFQIGAADDETFSAVPKPREPVRSLRAHADEPE